MSGANVLEVVVAALAAVAAPLAGLFFKNSANLHATELRILAFTSSAPQPLVDISVILAVVFGTVSTIVLLILLIGGIALRTHSLTYTLRYALMLVLPLLYIMLIKRIVARPRPPQSSAHIKLPSDFSFPSGHTASAAIILTVVIYLAWQTKARWAVFVGGILLMVATAVSRLIVAVHFPTDVLTSLIACPLLVVACNICFRAVKTRLSTQQHAQ